MTTEKQTIREILFSGLTGCGDHHCIINKVNMGTNGGCRCLRNLSPAQLNILQGKLHTIIDKKIQDE